MEKNVPDTTYHPFYTTYYGDQRSEKTFRSFLMVHLAEPLFMLVAV